MANQIDRYPGLRPYEQQDAELFFGRTPEIAKLASLIIAERTVVVFGKSGVGKSSLLNTIFSKNDHLQGYLQVKIRLQATDDEKHLSPIEVVKKEIELAIKNEFKLTEESLLLNKDQIIFDRKNPRLWEYIKLAELYLKKQEAKNTDVSMPAKKLVLIFDQFEKFFDLPSTEQEDFKLHLAELTHAMPPGRILKWVTGLHDLDRSPSIMEWYQQPDVKIVLSLRSDKLFLLNTLTEYLPQILKTRFELMPFSDENAKEAIESPALLDDTADRNFRSPKITFEETVIKQIISELSVSGEIDSSLLQVICWYIEKSTLGSDKKGIVNDTFHFTQQKFDAEINMSRILDEFYEQQVAGLKDGQQKNYPAATILKVKTVLEDKLVDKGQRTNVLASTLLGDLENDQNLVDALINARIIREEKSANRIFYELSHDKLVAPVERAKAFRKEKDTLLSNQKKAAQKQKVVFFAILFFAVSCIAGYFYWKAENAIHRSIKNRAQLAFVQNNHQLAFGLWDAYYTDWFRAINDFPEFDKFGDTIFYDLSLGADFAILKDGRIAVSNQDKSLFIWKINERKKAPVFTTEIFKPISGATGMVISHDKRFIASRDLSGLILVYDVKFNTTTTIQNSKSLANTSQSNTFLSFEDYKMLFLDRSNYLAFIKSDGNINIWNAETKRIVPLRVLERAEVRFTSQIIKKMFSVSADNRYLSVQRPNLDSARIYYLKDSSIPERIYETIGIKEVRSSGKSGNFIFQTIDRKLYTYNPKRPLEKKMISTDLDDIIYSGDMTKALIFEKKGMFVYDLTGDSIDTRFNTTQLKRRFSYHNANGVVWTNSGQKFIVDSKNGMLLIDLNKAESFSLTRKDSSLILTTDGYPIKISPDESKYCYINQSGELCVYPIDRTSSFKGYKKQIYPTDKLRNLLNLYQLDQISLFNDMGTKIAYIAHEGNRTYLSIIDLESGKETYRIKDISSLGGHFNDQYIHVFNSSTDIGGLMFFNPEKRTPAYYRIVIPELTDIQKRELGITIF